MKKFFKISDDNLIFIMVAGFLGMLLFPNTRFWFEKSPEELEEERLQRALDYVENTDWSQVGASVCNYDFEKEEEETTVEFEFDESENVESPDKIIETEKKEVFVSPPKKKKSSGVRKVTVTQYHPVTGQCDATPLITADNSKINLQKLKTGKLRWVAVSRDLLRVFKYGDVIELIVNKGNKKINGRYTIHDTMNPRFRNHVDILTPVGSPAAKWEGVTIRKI